MPTSPTDICNLALAHLGEAQITSIEGDDAASRACRLHYEQCRDAVLRSHRWNFATTRAELEESATEPAFGWDHQYILPADCLRVIECNDTEFGDTATDDYLVEGKLLLTDADSVDLIYIKRMEDSADYDPIFVEALALQLAAKLSESIRGTTGKTAELIEMYQRVTGPLARRVDANEGRRRKGLISVSSQAVRARASGV